MSWGQRAAGILAIIAGMVFVALSARRNVAIGSTVVVVVSLAALARGS